MFRSSQRNAQTEAGVLLHTALLCTQHTQLNKHGSSAKHAARGSLALHSHRPLWEGGWAPQPLWERVRLAVLAFTLLPLRLLLTLSCVSSYYLIVRISTIIPNDIVVRRIVTVCGKLWSRACLFCLGFVHIKWVRVGASEPRSAKRRSVAVVSNHMGWADILIQMARTSRLLLPGMAHRTCP
ncbi:hypothetical protein COO60DRAFT_73736 [Scenedesmus sp. NREL 46B-D3]|nr:hypothetical protein COO60DRAFT_73736 [Scenedesmus sp. NREL 46B-D3]